MTKIKNFISYNKMKKEIFKGLKSPDELSELNNCKRAIEVYWRGIYEFLKVVSNNEIEKDILVMSLSDAEELLQGHDIRYGAPGWGHAKLEYREPPTSDEKYFFVNSNGMDEKKFQEWQSFIGKKFEENELRFYYFG
jgi:hypothetical protein